MKMRHTAWTLFFALLLCASAGFAQDQKQDMSPVDLSTPLQPLNASPSPSPSGETRIRQSVRFAAWRIRLIPQPTIRRRSTPDMNTLAGAAPITLGSLQHSTRHFRPRDYDFTSSGKRPRQVRADGPDWRIRGQRQLNFNRVWSEYHFSTIYNGGETFNLGYGAATSYFWPDRSALSISRSDRHFRRPHWARWHVRTSRRFCGFARAPSLPAKALAVPDWLLNFPPSWACSEQLRASSSSRRKRINTGQAMRYQNSILGQAEYSFSRRSAFTFSGSYGLLHFTGTGYFNSTMVDAQAGYDYLLDPSNSIAILASYGKIDYTGTGISATGLPRLGPGTPYRTMWAHWPTEEKSRAVWRSRSPRGRRKFFLWRRRGRKFPYLVRFGQQRADVRAAPERRFL